MSKINIGIKNFISDFVKIPYIIYIVECHAFRKKPGNFSGNFIAEHVADFHSLKPLPGGLLSQCIHQSFNIHPACIC